MHSSSFVKLYSPMAARKYVKEIGSAAMLAAKRSAGKSGNTCLSCNILKKFNLTKPVIHGNSWDMFESRVPQKFQWPVWERIRLSILGTMFNQQHSFV